MALSLEIGLDAITSYRRLAYTPWHAIAEFVDNATQSYFDNQELLDQIYMEEEEYLEVSIIYDRDDEGQYLRISDNAMGISYQELERALHIGMPPPNPNGRSKYGMGLKTAASWLGNCWSIRTKKYGETVEHSVTIDVEEVARATDGALPYRERKSRRTNEHYTVIEIRDLNRKFPSRTLGKIRDYLRSMYREDFRNEFLTLIWRGDTLTWEDPELLANRLGEVYRKEFGFTVDGRNVYGWVGILAKGTRARAGFSILHSGRVVRGWPDSWRPSSLYGQIQGSNDLVNQRLVGEIHLDGFDVSHTKDDILWLGDQEDGVEEELERCCGDYKEIAKQYRKGDDDGRGPWGAEVDVAVDEFRRELESPEMVDRIRIDVLPPAEAVSQALRSLTSTAADRLQETLKVRIGSLSARIFLVDDISVNDPYVADESANPGEVLVLVNMTHPHWGQLKGSDGVLNYLRHCTYDAIAVWQARHQASRLDLDTLKILKDRLLRTSFEIEKHTE